MNTIPQPDFKTIHITPAAAGKMLSEDLTEMARRSGRNVGDYKRIILTFANSNRHLFERLEAPRAKGGTHISCSITEDVAKGLSNWNGERNNNGNGRGRGALCSFIFEKFIEAKMEPLIFPSPSI